MENALRIVSLEASNYKKLTAVLITPQGDVITLTGPNGAGKSSVLDAIWATLCGKDALPPQPLRKGATKGSTTVKIGNAKGEVQLIATRKLTPTGTTITLTDPDGKPHSSPQTLLDRMVGNLAFDPVQFVRMEDKPRLETLRKLVGLDFTQKDQERKRLYDERTLVNRDVANAKARLAGAPFDSSAPAEEVSVSDLMKELAKVEAANLWNATERHSLTVTEQKVAASQIAVDRLKAQLAEAEEALATVSVNASILRDSVGKLVDADTTTLKAKIAEAGTVNAKVVANRTHRQLSSAVDADQMKSDALTEKINAIDRAKEEELSKAKFPLPELTFNDEGVLLNGLPFVQASSAEQIRASVAVGMALNPTLRVIFIRDGSLLDETNLKVVADLAAANEYQVWLESVNSSDPTAIVIEDGHVKE